MICRRSLVSGRVQGVFYRGTCVRKAEALGILGFARNLPDGRVEVLACSETAAVEEFIAFLWEGSPSSHVDAVSTESVEPTSLQRMTGFSSA